MKTYAVPFLLIVLTLAVTVSPTIGDEGLWLFNNPPRDYLKKQYGFEFPKGWLDHLQKSSVRFNNGGSGSFVSPDGLVMTNHHVALDTIIKLGQKAKKDYVANGFLAKTRKEEAKALDLELNVLMEIEDVTKRVSDAVKPGLPASDAFTARRAVIAKIEEESTKKTGLSSDVVTLYQGGQYHLYRYKRYTDVRLVFAPEQQAGFFGGDPDNFSYPRYCLDCAFFRVYENGRPVKRDHYLKWDNKGVSDGELVFVSGHPGHTDRQTTVAELDFLRDIDFPYTLQRLFRYEVLLSVYGDQGQQYADKAQDYLFRVANSRKARKGMLAGLLDPKLMNKKKAMEKSLRAAAAKRPELKDVADAWTTIARIQKSRANLLQKYTVYERGSGFFSTLFDYARTLVRAAEEFDKPNSERLSGYADSGKKSLELKLFSTRTIYPDYEIVKLTDSLIWLTEQMGAKNSLVNKILAGKSPRERAAELVLGSKLIDVAERKRLYKGGAKAIARSKDPMILLAKLVDKTSRAVRKQWESQVDEPKRQAYDKIAKAKFAVYGTDVYPDATFTLRLSIGVVKGYEQDGEKIPFETTIAGMYAKAKRQNNKPPFDLAPRWKENKDKVNLKTPFNFVCTADIIGGNSGSPVVNRKGEVVGLIFDGNVPSLVWDFIFTDKQARAVSVCSQAITEALRSVYDMGYLADEIVGGASRRR